MSDSKMHSTGEAAKLCNTTVRTLQFYDEKGVLKPSAVSDGGRRLYSEEDLEQLRFVLMLKSLGLTLNAIKGVMESPARDEVLVDLLEEQARQLDSEIDERLKARELIDSVVEGIRTTGTVPASSIEGMEHIMEAQEQVRHVHRLMIGFGAPCTALEVAGLVYAIMSGNWVPFIVACIIGIIVGGRLARMYYDNTSYLCPHCKKVFKPEFWSWCFARHTPKTELLTCMNCGERDWCIETGSEALEKDAA